MVEVYIDENWTFEQAVNNVEVLKKQVCFVDTFFSYFEAKERIQFKRDLRKKIYALKFEQWKRERILETIYGDFEIEKLKKMI